MVNKQICYKLSATRYYRHTYIRSLNAKIRLGYEACPFIL